MTHNSSDTFQLHRQLLSEFVEKLPAALAEVVQKEQQQELMDNLHAACEALDEDPANGWHLAQNWLFSFIGNHPQLTPVVPRELLWFLGSDCLHFLSDEEIARFQQVEDKAAEENISWADAKRQVFNH